jgi:uncharacterized SAM-binding protein YcdF (DUF218 family)
LKALITYLTSPFSIGIGLMLFLSYQIYSQKSVPNITLIIVLTYILVVSTVWVPNFLISSLESQFPSFTYKSILNKQSNNERLIMVLGAGYNYDESLAHTQQLNTTALARLVEGYRIYKTLPNAKIILSSGTIYQPKSQAQVASFAALELGILAKDTLLLTKGLNTETEAISYLERFGKREVIIVTSALHMKRAMIIFSAYGIHAIPAPTAYTVKKSHGVNLVSYLPSLNNILKLKSVQHELLGILWFKLKQLFQHER